MAMLRACRFSSQSFSKTTAESTVVARLRPRSHNADCPLDGKKCRQTRVAYNLLHAMPCSTRASTIQHSDCCICVSAEFLIILVWLSNEFLYVSYVFLCILMYSYVFLYVLLPGCALSTRFLMHSYVCLCILMYSYVFLCILMYSYVFLCILIVAKVLP